MVNAALAVLVLLIVLVLMILKAAVVVVVLAVAVAVAVATVVIEIITVNSLGYVCASVKIYTSSVTSQNEHKPDTGAKT